MSDAPTKLSRTALFEGKICEPISPSKSYCLYESLQREVAIDPKPQESTVELENRFRQAAEALTQTIGGYHAVYFKDFVTKKPDEAAVPATATVPPPAQDKCAGEWKNRPVCKK